MCEARETGAGMSELFGAVNRPSVEEGEATNAERPARMVHFWLRRSSATVRTAMPQPQERQTTRSEGRSSGVGGGGGGGGGGDGGGGSRSGRSSGGKTGGSGGGGGGGLCLLSRLGQYKRQQHEQQKRRVAEKELDSLHHRIDKLLAKMEEHDTECPVNDDEECVVCLAARATMQTFPCEHKVVCRKCFIRTIQVAVAQRSLPLRCVVCRARILKLRHAASGSSPLCVNEPTSAPPTTVTTRCYDHARVAANNNNNNNNVATCCSHHPVPASGLGDSNASSSPAGLSIDACCRKSKSKSPLHWFASEPPSPPSQIVPATTTSSKRGQEAAGPPGLFWSPTSSVMTKDRSFCCHVTREEAQEVTVTADEDLD